MSGICGIIRLDGRKAEGIEAMTGLLERRGPDGSHIWRDGAIALGHALLATTPEALHENLPLSHPATGCTITADVRLDNRDDLLTALNLNKQSRIIGDGEIILRSYLTWGEACLERLLGDFAFAIWDPRDRKLFAARDQMGVRQLVYSHQAGRTFAFATEPRAVLAAPDIPHRLNEGRIADFLEGYLEMIDLTSTFFEGVVRLPPAHCLTVAPTGNVLRRYWSLEPEPELKLDSNEAYSQAFLDILTEAVRCRLRSAKPVGAMLSGGMDSGAVVALAAQLLQQDGCGPLRTVSAIGPDQTACVETRAIDDTLTIPGLQPHFVNWAEPETWRDNLRHDLDELEEPFDGHMNLPRAVYRQARRVGVNVLLDGVAGDVVLSTPDLIARLLRSGRWMAAWREIKGEQDFYGLSTAWQALLPDMPKAFIPAGIWRARWLRNQRQRDRESWSKSLPGLAERSNVGGRRLVYAREYITGFRTLTTDRAAEIVSARLVVARERYDRVAATFAVEPRDPFLDRRVVDFAIRLPAEQLQWQGWPKIMQRRALAGLLPDEVRWRKGRQHLGGVFTRELFKTSDLTEELKRLSDVMAETMTDGRSRHDHELHGIPATQIDPFDQFYLQSWLRAVGKIGRNQTLRYDAWRSRRAEY